MADLEYHPLPERRRPVLHDGRAAREVGRRDEVRLGRENIAAGDLVGLDPLQREPDPVAGEGRRRVVVVPLDRPELDGPPARQEAERIVPPDGAAHHVAEDDGPDPLHREGVVDRHRARGRPRLLAAVSGTLQELLAEGDRVVLAERVALDNGPADQRRELVRRQVVAQDQEPLADSQAVEHQHLLAELGRHRVHHQHRRVGGGDGVVERCEPFGVARGLEERDRDLALLEVIERDVARGSGLSQVLGVPGRRQDRHVQVRHPYLYRLRGHSS